MNLTNQTIPSGLWPANSFAAAIAKIVGIGLREKLRASLFTSICILVFLTPFTYWPTKAWIPTFAFYDVVLGLVFCLFIASVLCPSVKLPRLSIFDGVLSGFVAWVIISALTKGSWAAASPFVDMAILLFILKHMDLGPRQSKILAGVLLATGFCVALLGIGEYLMLHRSPATATFRAQNSFSGYLSLLLPLSLVLWVSRKALTRSFGMILTTTLAFAMALTSTRAGYIACIVGMLIFALVKNRKLLVLPVIYVFVFGLMLEEAREKFFTISEIAAVAHPTQQVGDQNLAIRGSLWQFAWGKFQSAPLTGIGVGNFIVQLDEYRQNHPEDARLFMTMEPHNTILKVLCELGLPGLLLFVSVLAGSLCKPIKWITRAPRGSIDSWSIGVASGLVAFLLHNLTNTLFILIPCVMGFWICLALLPVFQKEASGEQKFASA